jgi:hypothetical protein
MSKILLGGVEMCEHGLGHDVQNSWGGWAGSFGVGGVGLFNHSITIKRDGGAPVYGITTFTGYSAPSTIPGIGGAIWIDGAFYGVVWGGEYPGSGSTHWPHTFEWWTPPLAKGAHTLNAGAYVINPTWVFDANDGGVSICWEHP